MEQSSATNQSIMTTKSEMFERVIIDLSDLQSDLSSAEACEDTNAEDQAVANKLWDMLEATLERVYRLQRQPAIR
jgi:hypothetical protein